MKYEDRFLPPPLVGLTPIQKKYYKDPRRFPVVTAGRRSRKTLISRRKVLNFGMENDSVRLFQGAPTRPQAKAIYWDALKRETKYLRIGESESELKVFLANGTEIAVVGLSKPERIEGQVWHGGMITEAGNLKAGSFDENIRPVLSDTNGFCLLDGVPEGRNWFYDMALYSAGGAIPGTLPETGAFAENPNDLDWAFYSWFSSDVLSESEIASAKGKLDISTYLQEYEGSFEGQSGALYYAYSSDNLAMIKRDPDLAVSVGMDFNVNPMTAVIGHLKSDNFEQFGEAYLNNSNTYEMVKYLKDVMKLDPLRTVIYPDSTGRARESNATASDLGILAKAGFQVKAKPSNPRVRDRVNAVNSVLKTANGRVRYLVNPDTCPKTIEDLNKVEATDDGREDKTQEDRGLVHISSALGYLINFNFPVRGGKFKNV